jgi:hypothetical protein
MQADGQYCDDHDDYLEHLLSTTMMQVLRELRQPSTSLVFELPI